MSRVRTVDGGWAVPHGSVMMSSGEPRVAVIIENARNNRLYPLVMAAYGLPERERDVTGLVLQGASTVQIGAELFISPHTVQEHLKSVFDKTGVHSRRELVGRVFFTPMNPASETTSNGCWTTGQSAVNRGLPARAAEGAAQQDASSIDALAPIAATDGAASRGSICRTPPVHDHAMWRPAEPADEAVGDNARLL